MVTRPVYPDLEVAARVPPTPPAGTAREGWTVVVRRPGRAPSSPVWPAPGRDALVNRAVSLLTGGSCVTLVGRRTTGRSTTLRAIAAALGASGHPVVHVQPAAGAPPLHALHSALPIGLRARPEASVDYPQLERRYADLLEDGDQVLLVDDAETLDLASRGMVAALHRRFGVPVAYAHRPDGRPPSDSLSTLLPGIHLRLEGLELDGMLSALSHGAGPQTDPQVLARVHRESAGIPGLAIPMLEGTAWAGSRRRSSGGRATSDTDLVPSDADGAFDAYLEGCSSTVREALDVLAVAGPLPLDLACQVLSWDVVDDVLGLDLARVGSHPTGEVVAVHPPGLSTHLQHRRLTARRARAVARLRSTEVVDEAHQAALARALATARSPHREAPAVEDPQVDGDAADSMFASTWAGDRAIALGRWRSSPTVGTAAPLLRLLLSGPPDHEAVETVATGTDTDADHDSFASVEYHYLLARWRLLLGDPGAEAGRGLAADRERDSTLAGLAVALDQALAIEFGTVVDDPEATLVPLLEAGGVASEAARVVLAAWCLVRADHRRAVDLLEPVPDRWPPLLRDSAAYLRALALVGAGEHELALATARRLLAAAVASRNRAGYASARFVTAMIDAYVGEMEPARLEAFHVLQSDARSGTLLLSPDRSLRVLAGATALVSGEAALASPLLGLVGQTPRGSAALPYGDEAWLLAMELYVDDDAPGAAAVLDDIERRARARQHVFAGDTARFARLFVAYDPARARDLDATAQPSPGSLGALYVDLWRAVHEDRDPDTVVTVARRLAHLGATTQGARAYLKAAGLFRSVGRVAESNEARRAAHSLQGTGVALARSLGDQWDLSPRELQLLVLVAQGKNNPQIASDLGLSVRTVEAHMRNLRRKTGLSDRSQLAAALTV